MEYYSNDLVTLYHGDCAGELLPLLGECDVLITDPPYGINFHTNFTTARKRLPKTRGGEYPTRGDSDFLDVLAPWWRDALADFRDVLVASRKRIR